MFVRCAEGRSAYLEFEADAIRLRDVEELDELALDAADLLDRACPELNAVNFGDGAADLVGSGRGASGCSSS